MYWYWWFLIWLMCLNNVICVLTLLGFDVSDLCHWYIDICGHGYFWLMYWVWLFLIWLTDVIYVLRLVVSDMNDWMISIDIGRLWCVWFIALMYWCLWPLMCLTYVIDIFTLVATDVADWCIETCGFWYDWLMWFVYWPLICLIDLLRLVVYDMTDWRELCIDTGCFLIWMTDANLYWQW